VVRETASEILAVIHTFGGTIPEKIILPVKGKRILRVMCSENNVVSLQDEQLTVELKAPFEAVAVHLG
jgi:alpha-galactosidase